MSDKFLANDIPRAILATEQSKSERFYRTY